MPRRITIRRPLEFLETEDDRSIRLKLIPSKWSERRNHHFAGEKVQKLEDKIIDMMTILETSMHWITTIVLDARGDDHSQLYLNQQAEEESTEYVIRDDQYVICPISFHETWCAERGLSFV